MSGKKTKRAKQKNNLIFYALFIDIFSDCFGDIVQRLRDVLVEKTAGGRRQNERNFRRYPYRRDGVFQQAI